MQQNLVEVGSGKQITQLSNFDRLLSMIDIRLDYRSFFQKTSIV